jgi:putative FmdB family regulatory protein
MYFSKLFSVPIYEYRCKKCGKTFEVHQSMMDDPLKIHDECGGDLTKVYTNVGVVMKGSGFYKTDSRKSTSTSTKKESSSSDKSSSTAKSDSTKASKPKKDS